MVSQQLHETPAPKMPDPALRRKPAITKEEKIDHQVEDSFPASDPLNRESDSSTPDTHAVKEAEKQVKDGKVTPHKY